MRILRCQCRLRCFGLCRDRLRRLRLRLNVRARCLRHLLLLCRRAMALPVGRGMFSLASAPLRLTEALRMPPLLQLAVWPTEQRLQDGSEKARGRVWRLAVLADQGSRGLEVR